MTGYEFEVTVMMNCYRETKDRFDRAVNSILNTKVKVQLILSTVEGDESIEWAKAYPMEVVINPTAGIFSQINAMIPHVKGKYVCYSSSNDIMLTAKLTLEMGILERTKRGVCYSAFWVIQGSNRHVRPFHRYDHGIHLQNNFVSDCAMMRTELLKKYAPFDISAKNHAYHDLWLRIYRGEGEVFVYNRIPTWEYVITSDSQHVRMRRDAEWKRRNEEERQTMLAKFR